MLNRPICGTELAHIIHRRALDHAGCGLRYFLLFRSIDLALLAFFPLPDNSLDGLFARFYAKLAQEVFNSRVHEATG